MKKYKNIFAILLFPFLFMISAAIKAAPEKVVIGVYVNDIQAIDLRTHSYVVDMYVWFRWSSEDLNPGETFEFMNTFDPEAHVGKLFYDEPVAQPDGSKYMLLRHQGAFSSKFDVAKYPFDTQQLQVAIEDSEMGADELVYVPDETPIIMNKAIRLPGYIIGKARLEIINKPYPTNFGDLSDPDAVPYSRATVIIPLSRPLMSGFVKSLLPMLLIVASAGLALLLDPAHVEARIGLTITALLALVALQFTAASSLPEVGYLLMIDQLYLASYLYILTVIALVVRATRIDEQGAIQGEKGSLRKLASSGPDTAIMVSMIYIILVAGILFFNLS